MTENLIRLKLIRLMGLTLLVSMVMVTVHCRRSGSSDIIVYSSSPDGDRLTKRSGLSFTSDKDLSSADIKIDELTLFQKIDGFGATFNEAGMICINSLDPETKDSVLKMLSAPESGAGFTLMKSPVAACDFASAGPWYTYNDTPGDTSMKHFTIKDIKLKGEFEVKD